METCRFICISEWGGKRFYASGKALELRLLKYMGLRADLTGNGL